MIYVINFRQLYKRLEITEIKQIYRRNNPTDLMTKNKPFSASIILIDINRINLHKTEWVESATAMKETKRI